MTIFFKGKKFFLKLLKKMMKCLDYGLTIKRLTIILKWDIDFTEQKEVKEFVENALNNDTAVVFSILEKTKIK